MATWGSYVAVISMSLLACEVMDVDALTCYKCDSNKDDKCSVRNQTDSWRTCNGDVCYVLSATAFGWIYESV